MKHNTTLITALLLVVTFQSFAQSPEDIVAKFFSQYQSIGAAQSLDSLYATNPWVSQKSDAIKNLKTQLSAMDLELVGEFRGHELITKKRIGNSLVLMSYLVKFDRQPIRFTFEFYKPQEKWIIYAFLFDDNLDDELEEAAKLHMLQKVKGN